MFKKDRAHKLAREVTPLLRGLWPDKTDEQRMSALQLFSACHDGEAIDSLDQSHIDELERTLRYYISLRPENYKLGESGSPGVEDACPGCFEFKASMLELQTGVTVRRDADGRVESPLVIANDPSLDP